MNRIAEAIHDLALAVLGLSLVAVAGTAVLWGATGSDTPFYLALVAVLAAAGLARDSKPFRKDGGVRHVRKRRS